MTNWPSPIRTNKTTNSNAKLLTEHPQDLSKKELVKVSRLIKCETFTIASIFIPAWTYDEK